MRVTHVSTDYLPFIGGVAQHIVEITRSLSELGHQVEIIAPYRSERFSDLSGAPFEEQRGNVHVWRIPFVINKSVRFFSGKLTSRWSDTHFCREMIERLRKTRPDVVHWHAIDSRHNPMTRWTESARVWTNHTSNFIVGLKSPKLREYYRTEAAQADEIIAPSEELAELTGELGYERKRIHFISNGVDSTRFSPAVAGDMWRSRLGLNASDKLVLCPRRPEKKNGVSYGLKAAISLMKNGVEGFHFAVAGSFIGPRSESEEDLLVDLVKSSGFEGRLHLLGRIENTEMPALYAASDVIAMPSLIEATSLSAMEAMSTAKPIVSTDVGGLPFLVRDNENGFLVSPRNPELFAERLTRLLSDPELARRMGLAGRKRVEDELDWAAIARQVGYIYESALGRYRDRTK